MADDDPFMQLMARVPLRTSVRTCSLERANQALADLRAGRLGGAAVLVP